MKFKSNSNTNLLTDETLDVKIIDSYALLVGSKKNVLVIGKNDNLNKILKKNSCNVTEISFNPNNLKIKKIEYEKLDDFTLDVIDLQKLEDKKFDVILVQNILFTLNPKQFLKKLSSFLSKNGYIVCSMPNITNAKTRISFLNGNLNLDKFGADTGMNFLTISNILDILSEINFSIAKLLRVKQNFFPQKIDAKDYGVPNELIECILAEPESETHTFIFKIISENSVSPTLRKWLSTFTYNAVTKRLRDILVINKDKISILEQTIKDKDEYIKQVIQDKDEFLKQVIQDKDEFLNKVIKDKDDLIHGLERAIKDKEG